MPKKYNLRLIRARRSYTPSEIAILLSVDIKTVYRWIDGGLQVMEKTVKPLLIMGSKLKDYLSGQKVKIFLSEDEYYCLSCKRAVIAKEGSEIIEKTGYSIGNESKDQCVKKAKCNRCGRHVQKYIKVSQND